MVLVCVEFLVVLLDVWLYWGNMIPSPDLAKLFDSTSESGFGSWLAVTQTMLIAVTLWVMAAAIKSREVLGIRWVSWTVLALFFTYIAFDDGNQFHERIGAAFADSRASESGVGAMFPSYYWQLLFGPFFVGMGVFLGVFLWRELRTASQRLLVGLAFALFTFAVALDFVDGLSPDHRLNLAVRLAADSGLEQLSSVLFGRTAFDTIVHLSRSVEESIEMLAMTILWAAFLMHLVDSFGEVSIRFNKGYSKIPEDGEGRRSFFHPNKFFGRSRKTETVSAARNVSTI